MPDSKEFTEEQKKHIAEVLGWKKTNLEGQYAVKIDGFKGEFLTEVRPESAFLNDRMHKKLVSSGYSVCYDPDHKYHTWFACEGSWIAWCHMPKHKKAHEAETLTELFLKVYAITED